MLNLTGASTTAAVVAAAAAAGDLLIQISSDNVSSSLLPILLPSVATVNCGQRPQHWRGYREVI